MVGDVTPPIFFLFWPVCRIRGPPGGFMVTVVATVGSTLARLTCHYTGRPHYQIIADEKRRERNAVSRSAIRLRCVFAKTCQKREPGPKEFEFELGPKIAKRV